MTHTLIRLCPACGETPIATETHAAHDAPRLEALATALSVAPGMTCACGARARWVLRGSDGSVAEVT